MAPSRSRYTLLRFTFALSIITYVDRVCISSAAPAIRDDLGLTAVQMGWVFSAFTFAYAAFEIPSGWLGDVMGPRKVLMRIVLWWSAFTAASGLAWNFVSLLATRFLFGAGEAGAFPNISRSFLSWFPPRERGTAHGVVFMGSRLGAAVAPPLVVVLITAMGWRAAFIVFGVLGVIWSAFWWHWFRDDPADHPSVNREELELIRDNEPSAPKLRLRWRDLLDANLLRVCLMYFCVGYGLYFYLTWLPTYFKEARGFTTSQSAILASIVLTAGALATLAGGWLTDVLVRRHGLKAGRSIGGVAMPLSAAFILAAAFVPDPLHAAILMALAAGAADLCLSPSWAMCHDIGGSAAGAVTGAMNTLGNLGGAISPLVVGYSVQLWGSWSTPLVVSAGIYLAGGVLTLTVNPYKQLARAREPEHPEVQT
jgi:MFS family permease